MTRNPDRSKDFLQRNPERGRKILAFTKWFGETYHYPPTFRQIGTAAGIDSTSVMAFYINGLTQAGYLSNTKGTTRSTFVTQQGLEYLEKTSTVWEVLNEAKAERS